MQPLAGLVQHTHTLRADEKPDDMCVYSRSVLFSYLQLPDNIRKETRIIIIKTQHARPPSPGFPATAAAGRTKRCDDESIRTADVIPSNII